MRRLALGWCCQASSACSSGNVSMIGRMFLRTAKFKVSSESCATPEYQPDTDNRPSASAWPVTWIGSPPSRTISSPFGRRPLTRSDCSSARETVASTTDAPPSAFKASPASPSVLSIYSSAPSCRASFSLSRPRLIATVRKPILSANWIARCPTPPTPWTATVSPGRACACRSALNAVVPPHINGAASSKVSPSGIRATASCGATTYSAYPPSYDIPTIVRLRQLVKSPRRQYSQVKSTPPDQPTPTRWPTSQTSTPAPTASTTPAISCPGTRGNLVPNRALRGIASPPQIPQAR